MFDISDMPASITDHVEPPARDDGGVILHVGPLGGDEATELAVAHALVRRAGDGEVDAARRAGFDTAVRAVGGRAVAYTDRAVVVDHVRAEAQTQAAMDQRFEAYGRRFAGLFADLGIDARVGPVPGEYCPGAHSVNARGVVKLVGTAQRVLARAWLFSSLVTVGDEERLRQVLTEVYDCLDLPFDPASVGSVSAEAGDVAAAEVADLVARRWGVRPEDAVAVDAATLGRAATLVDDHRVPARQG